MRPHVRVERAQRRELLPLVARHLAEQRPLPVHDLVVRERQHEVLVPGVHHRERQLVVVPAPVHGLLPEVAERVVHPPQVPLEGEAEPAAVGGPRDARPGGRLLREHRDTRMRRMHHGVQLLEERDRVEVLPAAEAVRHPFAGLARVVEVEHRGDGVDAQPVGVELLEPVEGVREEEVPHLVAAVVEDERAPVGMRAAARVGVLVQRGAVEARERPLVPREVRGDPVQQHADPLRVQRVDERTKVVRLAERRVRCVVAAHLVPPRRPERMLHHRHQLDVGEPELDHVLRQLLGEVEPAEPLPPRARVDLVDRHRRRQRVRCFAPLEPIAVSPRVPRAIQDGGGLRRRLGAERDRVGLQARHAVRPQHGELVRLPLACVRRDPCPDAGDRLRLERIGALAPVVPVADDRHRARVRRPHREARSRVACEWMPAQLLPQPLVAPLAEEVQVDLAGPAHAVVSSRRRSPTSGIDAHSGRFRVS